MSANWSAYAVVGCEVTGKLFQKVIVPGCRHTQLPSSAPFCSQCGNPSNRIEKHPISGYNNDTAKIGTFSVVSSTDSRRQFVGLTIEAEDDDRTSARMQALPDFATIKAALHTVLEPMGLWTEESFGLWAVLRCSY